MAEYYVLVRVEAAASGEEPGRGRVISIRPVGNGVTNAEKRKLLILQVEMTEAEAETFRKEITPRANYVPASAPPADEDEHVAWLLAYEEASEKLPLYGKAVDFSIPVIQEKISDIDDMYKGVEPIVFDKALFSVLEPEK